MNLRVEVPDSDVALRMPPVPERYAALLVAREQERKMRELERAGLPSEWAFADWDVFEE